MLKTRIVFIFLLLWGLYLRFWEQILPYGWDQRRDAEVMKLFFKGIFPLTGPRTGVGHMTLGPLYFYLLTPFFLISQTYGGQLFNFTANIATFITIFFITKRLFNKWLGLFVIFLYTINPYMIDQNRIAWNVTLIPIVSFAIYYFSYKLIIEQKYKWSALLLLLCGLFFHIHFTAVIFPVMLTLLWLFNPSKKLFLLLIKSLPFYFIGVIPLLFNAGQGNLAYSFLHDYYLGIHLQFIIHRLPDILMQYRLLLFKIPFIDYILSLTSVFFCFRSKYKIHARIIIAWLLAMLAIFGIYGGAISEYYFLPTIPVVYYSLLLIILRIKDMI